MPRRSTPPAVQRRRLLRALKELEALVVRTDDALPATEPPPTMDQRAERMRKAETSHEAGARYAIARSVAAKPVEHAPGQYRVDHYPNSRFWGVYDSERLIAVTVYKRGAREVAGRLEMQERAIADLKRRLGILPSLG